MSYEARPFNPNGRGISRSGNVSGFAGTEASDDWKGGFDRASWMGRYAEALMQAGAPHSEAWEWALNAWEASDEDCDPDEAASADIAYSTEDAT